MGNWGFILSNVGCHGGGGHGASMFDSATNKGLGNLEVFGDLFDEPDLGVLRPGLLAAPAHRLSGNHLSAP